MTTNVKKVILTIMFIVDLLTVRYANIDIAKAYNNFQDKNFVSINNTRNTLDKAQESKNTVKEDIKQQPPLNKNNEKTITQPETNNSNKEINQSSDSNKNIQENNQQPAREENQNKKQLSRGSNLGYETDITLTFYSSLAEENGGYAGINCTGKKLTPGMVANNVLPLGTEIYTSEFGTLTVADRGGSNFDTIHRLDVYIPRNKGENDSEYKKRVNDMGKVKVKGYIVKQ